MTRLLLLLGAFVLWVGQAQATALPQLPINTVDTTMPTVNGSTLQATCATLQAQINAAAALNVNLTHEVILATGTTCTGPYKLASHTGGTGWILIKGSGYSSLPPSGTRVSPTDAALMPTVKYGVLSGGSFDYNASFQALTGAQRYRIIGINMVQDSAITPNWALVILGYNNANATGTGYIIIDRCVLQDTDATHETNRGVMAESELGNTALIDSYVSGIKSPNRDTQAWASVTNPGPILVRNNFLEAAGENFILCGGTPVSQALQPHDITFQRNLLSKNSAWWGHTSGFVNKTLFELKCGIRVLVEGNTFENSSWDDGGNAFRLTPRSGCSLTANWLEVSDITIRYNLVRNVTNWINAFGADSGSDNCGVAYLTAHSKRWYVHDNLTYNLGWKCNPGDQCGNFFSIQRGGYLTQCSDPTTTCQIEDLTIAHNTVDGATIHHALYVDSAGQINLDFNDNLINSKLGYGIYSPGIIYGTAALNFGWAGPTWRFTNNSIAGLGGNSLPSSAYPQGSGNSYPTLSSSFLWTNAASGDYTLQTSSPAKGTASDGTDRGVNFAAFNAARAGSTPPPVDTQAPAPVTGLVVSANGGFQSTASWNATTDTGGSVLAGYNLKICTGAACTPSTFTATVPASTLTKVLTGLLPNTTYGIAVNAFDGNSNQSTYSAPVYVTTTSGAGTTRTTTITDDFSRADNADIGSAWDVVTGMIALKIVSQRVLPTTIATESVESNNTTIANDQWAQITTSVLTGAVGAEDGVILRAATGATTFYRCLARINGAATSYIQKYVAGALTTLASENATVWGSTDQLRCEVKGSAPATLNLYRIVGASETLILTTTDSSIASGKVGIYSYVDTAGSLSSSQIGFFSAGTFSASIKDTIIFDAASTSGDNISQPKLTWPHPTASLNNRGLIVCSHARGAVSANTIPSSVTDGGVSLTKLHTDTVLTGTPDYMTTTMWELVAPPVGTPNIVITWPNFPGRYGVGAAVSLSGVDQTSPNDSTPTGNTGTGVTLSTTVTTIADNAWIVDCALGRSDAGLTVGGGQTQREQRIVGAGSGIDGAGLSTFVKTPAGVKAMTWTQATDNWTQSAVSLTPATITAVVAPRIASATADASGANLTYGATTPTTIRVTTSTTSVVELISAFPAGRYTKTWVSGMGQVCFFARDASGVESSSAVDSKCVDLTGIVVATDTTPAVMTLLLPTAHLPFGTTSTIIALTLDKPVTDCRYDPTNIAYGAMDPLKILVRASLKASATVSGLTTGTVNYYAQCTFFDALGVGHPTVNALQIPVIVDASTADVTPPGDVTNLAVTPLSATQVSLISSVASDAVSYQDYLSYGTGITDYEVVGTPSTSINTIVNVFPGLVANFVRKAVDTSNNLSTNFSNVATLTLAPDVDVTPPSVMMNLRGFTYRQSALLQWDNGSDDRSGVTALVEQSTDGVLFSAVTSGALAPFVIHNLAPSTLHYFRGKFADAVGNLSPSYSNVLQLTTKTTGLNYGRQPLTQDRLKRVP